MRGVCWVGEEEEYNERIALKKKILKSLHIMAQCEKLSWHVGLQVSSRDIGYILFIMSS